MKNLVFAIQSVFAGLGISAIAGALIGFVTSLIKSEHAHQLLPDWLILMVVGGIIGGVLALALAIYMIYTGSQNLKMLAIRVGAATIILLLIIALISR